jgi:hypothetical protein
MATIKSLCVISDRIDLAFAAVSESLNNRLSEGNGHRLPINKHDIKE